MSAKTQVVISSDLNGQLYQICVSDLLTGNILMTFNSSGVVDRHCVDLIGDRFLVSSQKDSPIINVWSLEGKNQIHMKMVSLGKVSALKVTNDGMYCIVAIATKVYIWQIISGDLLAIVDKHYQPIRCIKVTTDNSYFVTGGEDGIALVWRLSNVIAIADISSHNTSAEPTYKWCDSKAAITDIHIGFGGYRARCAICSADQSCRIYEFISGELVITIAFDTPLCSVVMDSAESYLFVGGQNGNIYETKLYEKPSNLIDRQNSATFIGHSHAVTCLAVSIDGLALISGSNDKHIKIWHISSKQCMRSDPYKGPISNVMVFATPSGLNSNSKSSTISIQQFKRQLISNASNSNDNDSSVYEKGCVNVKINKSLSNRLKCLSTELDFSMKNTEEVIDSLNDNEKEDTIEELRKVKRLNAQIYNYAVDSIFKNIL